MEGWFEGSLGELNIVSYGDYRMEYDGEWKNNLKHGRGFYYLNEGIELCF
jgi:hypothetical protein